MKIGLEVHVALPTKTKLFCSCGTDASEPNSSICPICMGFPGSKPMLNKEALKVAINIASALGCKITRETSFVRKVYFYPDLPKSYQITQLNDAVGAGGTVELSKKAVGIRRIQLEEDPAKVIRGDAYTLLDFNRSGIPLVEIVTEPDIVNEEELREFLNELKSILYYLDVDIDKELKVDLNISLDEDRVEIKNVTGLKNLVDAARFEIKRQQKVIDNGKKVVQETRSYNEKKMQTESSREKETDEEYGFIYEPDLTSYETSKFAIAKPIIASKIVAELAKNHKANGKTLLELVQFDRKSLDIIERSKEKWPMELIINVVEVLKHAEALDINADALGRVLALAKSGTPISEEIVKRVMSGKDIGEADVNVDQIDAEIKKMIREKSELLIQYEKNPKVFNFIVGTVAKKFKTNPKFVSQRLSGVIEESFKSTESKAQ
jgi:aspartyl-tRNA(Asn)/glutamyl-tRNA(Gln) amidotransferase subunit B